MLNKARNLFISTILKPVILPIIESYKKETKDMSKTVKRAVLVIASIVFILVVMGPHNKVTAPSEEELAASRYDWEETVEVRPEYPVSRYTIEPGGRTFPMGRLKPGWEWWILDTATWDKTPIEIQYAKSKRLVNKDSGSRYGFNSQNQRIENLPVFVNLRTTDGSTVHITVRGRKRW